MMIENSDKPRKDEEALRLLSLFLDGELPAPEARRLEARMDSDHDLRQAHDEFKALDCLLDKWPAPPLADVRQAVMSNVQADLNRATPRRRANAWRWAGVAWAATWVMGGMLTGLTLWAGIDQRLNEQAAAETMAQDMTLAMIMTEDWTPPIAIDEDAQ